MISVKLCDELAVVGQEVVSARIEAVLAQGSIAPLTCAYLDYRLREANVSIATFAEDSGFSRQYVYRVLRGNKPVSAEMIRALCAYTPITAEELAFVAAVQLVDEVRHGGA